MRRGMFSKSQQTNRSSIRSVDSLQAAGQTLDGGYCRRGRKRHFASSLSLSRPQTWLSGCQQFGSSEGCFKNPEQPFLLTNDDVRRGEPLFKRQPGPWVSEAKQAFAVHQFYQVKLHSLKINHKLIVHHRKTVLHLLRAQGDDAPPRHFDGWAGFIARLLASVAEPGLLRHGAGPGEFHLLGFSGCAE